MQDKYTAGLVSGLLAGAVCMALEFVLSGVFRIGRFAAKEFGGMVILLHVPRTPGENALAIVVYLGLCSFMGGVFAYFLELVSSRYDLVKGMIFGLAISGAIWATTSLFRLRPEHVSPAVNGFVDFLSTAVYGLTLALIYRGFYHRGHTPA